MAAHSATPSGWRWRTSSWLRPRLTWLRSRLSPASVQVLLACAGVLAGAGLLGHAVFAVTLMVLCALAAGDGLLRQPRPVAELRSVPTLVEILERERRAG